MSQENVALVRQVYEAWNRDDFQWVLDHAAPDIEFQPNAGLADLDQVYRGRDGIEQWYGRWREAWGRLSYRVERLEDLGNSVLALVTVIGEGRQSGVEVRDDRAHLFTVEAGLCTRFQSFMDSSDALKAAGLQQ